MDFHVNSVKIFPNPVSDRFSVEINLQNKSSINIRLCNQLGKEIILLESKIYEAGRHVIPNIAIEKNMKEGVYYCMIQTENQQITKKIVIINPGK
jgi:hypothetical protein